MKAKISFLMLSFLFLLSSMGCTGVQTFGGAARSGDTVSLALGRSPELNKEEVGITIVASGGGVTQIPAGDAAIRAFINLYPDPMSRLIVERETGSFADDGYFYSVLMENTVTGADKDFFQTVLILDLPAGLSSGPADIILTDTGGQAIASTTIEVLPGSGSSHLFQIQEGLMPNLGDQLVLAERAPHYAVEFSGTVIPYAVQIELTHDPDQSLGGTGNPYIVNSRGDVKSVNWSADGNSLRVIMISANNALTDNVNFNFFVVGGVQNLQLDAANVKAYDINGDEILTGFNAQLTPYL